MVDKTKAAVSRAKEIAERYDFSYEMIEHGHSGMTSQQASEALGVDKKFIIKSLLLYDGVKSVGAIIRGSDMLDTEKLEKESGVHSLRLVPTGKVREVLNFDVGGIPPTAFKDRGVPAFVDLHVVEMPFVFGSGGTPYTGIKFDPRLLSIKLGYSVAAIAKPVLQGPNI